jgi:hypothetical protein
MRISTSIAIVLTAVAVTAAMPGSMANNAAASTAKLGLEFRFTGVPDSSQIYAGSIVSISALVRNHSHTQQTGALVFPAWVHVHSSNRHLVNDKVGNLVWNAPTLKPGRTMAINLTIVVTTAWDESSCPAGDWHFGAKLYTPDVQGHLAYSREMCFEPPTK